MDVVRHADAPHYLSPGHHDMEMRRLQGLEASPATAMWMGLSIIRPGGRIDLSTSPLEKLYFVIEGQPTISNGVQEAVLAPLDTVRIAPNEPRSVRNDTDTDVRLLLTMQIAPA